MTVLKQYDSGTSQWIPIVSGVPGPAGPTGATGAGGALGYYAVYSDSTTQTNPVANAPMAMTFNTLEENNGVSVASNSRITFANAGTYNIQFSAQIDKTDSGTDYIDVWLRKNGADVPRTNTRVYLVGNDTKAVASWNFVYTVADNDYLQIMWASLDTDVVLFAQSATETPARPAIPSVIMTATQVMYTQLGPTGATGAQGPEGVSVNIADTLPASPVAGDTWYESDTGKFFVYYDSFWVEVSGTGSIGAQGPIGNTGPTGATGAQGPAATIAVGTTTTGAAGSSASVTNSGTSSAATFDFTIPQGNVGATGTAATITAGTTTTGAAGSSASVTNSGTSSAAVFDFTVPAGATGPTGPEGGTTTLTTKGDILTRGASALARIGVGSNGTFLKANSSTATGLEWGSIPSVSILDDVGDVVITSATSGQFLKWDGTNWVNATIIGGATVSDSAPSSPTTGQLWYESDSGKTFVYYDSFWVEVGGAAAYDQIIGSVQAKGDILAGTASQAISRLGVGTDTQRLIANSSTSTGLAWANDTPNTVIDAKGDLLVGATADVIARLPVGTNSQMLVANSGATNGISWADQPTGFRNVVINGGMDVWQRGTSFTNPASIYGFTADRMFPLYDGSGATRTISQGQFDPYLSGASITATPPAGTSPTYFLRWNQSVAGSGASYNLLYANRVENVRLLAGKTVTLSFYAKAGANITMPALEMEQTFGTGGSPSAGVYTTVASNIAVTTSWQRFTYTFTMPSAAGKVIGTDANSTYTSIRMWLPINTTFILDLWGIQLEAGSQATPFEQRPYTTELQLCQRYFWALTVPGQVTGATVSGYGNACYMNVSSLNPVPMRVPPAPQTHPSYPTATYPPYIADFNSNLRTITAVNLSSPNLIQFVYNSSQLTTSLSMGLNYADANRTLWLNSEF